MLKLRLRFPLSLSLGSANTADTLEIHQLVHKPYPLHYFLTRFDSARWRQDVAAPGRPPPPPGRRGAV
jgi:hypothetical protein